VPRSVIAVWGFVGAGLLFLVAAALSVLHGGHGKPAFLILGMVFLLLGAAIARKNRRA